MKIGISQLIVPRDWSVERFLQEAQTAGYEAVELACRDEGDLTPDTPKHDLDRIRERADTLGIELNSMTHGHSRPRGNLLVDGEDRDYALQRTTDALRVAAHLGIDCSLHTLGRLSPDLPYDDAYRNGVDSLRRLAPVAEDTGVAVAVEFIWNGFLFSPLEMARFLDEVDSPAVGFYFDSGNMAVFQYPQHWARVCARHIKRVHLKDWQGRPLNGSWHALTEGGVDFAAVMAELRRGGYRGPLISEVAPGLASLKETAAAIRRIRDM